MLRDLGVDTPTVPCPAVADISRESIDYIAFVKAIRSDLQESSPLQLPHPGNDVRPSSAKLVSHAAGLGSHAHDEAANDEASWRAPTEAPLDVSCDGQDHLARPMCSQTKIDLTSLSSPQVLHLLPSNSAIPGVAYVAHTLNSRCDEVLMLAASGNRAGWSLLCSGTSGL